MTEVTLAYRRKIGNLYTLGETVGPRGQPTRELQHDTFVCKISHPIVACKSRDINLKFMLAEAAWILSGDSSVSGIAPYNRHISQFSDDGHEFYGAYGPRFIDQVDTVVGSIVNDPDTRQAGLTLWRQNPRRSKDIPCTVAIWFLVRKGIVNTHVFMRSSDIWLGVPYDIFNFSMMTYYMMICVNIKRPGTITDVGNLYVTAASRHLYERDVVRGLACMDMGAGGLKIGMVDRLPLQYQQSTGTLIDGLEYARDNKEGRWWTELR